MMSMAPSLQRDIVKMVVGTHQLLESQYHELARQRKNIWRGWIEGTDNVTLYNERHLPYIIVYFPDVWNFTLLSSATAADVTPAMRYLAKAEIIELMVCMYILPPESLAKVQQIRRSRRKLSRGSLSTLQLPKRRRIATPDNAIDDEESEDKDEGEADIEPDSGDPDPVQVVLTKLRKSKIRKMIYSENHDNIIEAGSLEIGAVVAHEEKGDLIRANALIDEYGGKALSVADFNAMKSIPNNRLWGIIQRIRDLKEEIQSKLPVGLFRSDREEFLLTWMHHGLLYTDKIRPPRLMMRKSKDNSQDMLTDVAAHKCRHICMCYNISFSKFLGLTHAFYSMWHDDPLTTVSTATGLLIIMHQTPCQKACVLF